MKIIGTILGWLFTYILCPVIVIGVFVGLVAALAILTGALNGALRLRRLVAASLPIVVLVFFVVMSENDPHPVGRALEALGLFGRFAVGAIIGGTLMEVGKRVLRTDNEVAASMYALFLSTLVASLLWAMMGGFVRDLNVVLLGMVIAGGLHVIFRGPPELEIES